LIRPLNVKAGRVRTSFKALLDNPLPPTAKLRRLLKTKAPWEQ